MGIQAKRLKAGGDTSYLLRVLNGINHKGEPLSAFSWAQALAFKRQVSHVLSTFWEWKHRTTPSRANRNKFATFLHMYGNERMLPLCMSRENPLLYERMNQD